ARSASRYEKQFSSLESMAARTASSSSAGDRSPARNASTSEHASPVQGASAIALASPTVTDRRAAPTRSGGGYVGTAHATTAGCAPAPLADVATRPAGAVGATPAPLPGSGR